MTQEADKKKSEDKAQPQAATPTPQAETPAPKGIEVPMPESAKQPEAKVEESGEERITMSKSELADVVTELVRREIAGKSSTENLLEQILDQQTLSSGGPRMMMPKAFAEADIDKDDYLDTPVVLFCYSHSHICMGDKRFGQAVKTPYDTPIRFKHLMRYKKPGSSKYNDEMITMSSISIRSKKEAMWMRKHTLFGIKYFEDIQDVKDVSKTFSDKLVETSMHLNTLSEYEVIERAKMEKIEITRDIDDLRRRLVYIITEKAMQGGVQSRTHHNIAAASPDFDHKSDASMIEATKEAERIGPPPPVTA